MLETSVGPMAVTVSVENEFLWAATFDDVGHTKRETTVESLTNIRAGWTAALTELGLSPEEAAQHTAALLAAAEAAFEEWIERQPEGRRRQLTESWERWKRSQGDDATTTA